MLYKNTLVHALLLISSTLAVNQTPKLKEIYDWICPDRTSNHNQHSTLDKSINSTSTTTEATTTDPMESTLANAQSAAASETATEIKAEYEDLGLEPTESPSNPGFISHGIINSYGSGMFMLLLTFLIQ